MRRSFHFLTLFLGIGLLAAACDEKKSASASPIDSDAATDKFATADPKLEQALKAAAAAASSNANDGPPPHGVFAPGVADHRHPKSTPTKVDVIAEGTAPRVSLAAGGSDASTSATSAAVAGPAVLEVAMQIGPRSALPTVDFGLLVAPAKKDEGGDAWLVANVKKVTPAKEQYAELPPAVEKEIATLAGSQIRFPLPGEGPESGTQTLLAKNAPSELERLVLNGAEALLLATVPFPSKPVGVGAQWIAETRMTWSGVDSVIYRAFKVKSIDGTRVHLTLDVKGYAAEKELALPGLPKGATIAEFEAEAQGEMDVVKGEPLARQAAIQEHVAMLFRTPGPAGEDDSQPGEAPQNMGSLQSQGTATFVRGDDLRSAAR